MLPVPLDTGTTQSKVTSPQEYGTNEIGRRASRDRRTDCREIVERPLDPFAQALPGEAAAECDADHRPMLLYGFAADPVELRHPDSTVADVAVIAHRST